MLCQFQVGQTLSPSHLHVLPCRSCGLHSPSEHPELARCGPSPYGSHSCVPAGRPPQPPPPAPVSLKMTEKKIQTFQPNPRGLPDLPHLTLALRPPLLPSSYRPAANGRQGAASGPLPGLCLPPDIPSRRPPPAPPSLSSSGLLLEPLPLTLQKSHLW